MAAEQIAASMRLAAIPAASGIGFVRSGGWWYEEGIAGSPSIVLSDAMPGRLMRIVRFQYLGGKCCCRAYSNDFGLEALCKNRRFYEFE